MTRRLGASSHIVEATELINRHQLGQMVGLVRKILMQGTVGIIWVCPTSRTHQSSGKPGRAIAEMLAEAGYRVLVHDPQALAAAIAVLRDKVEATDQAEHCAMAADLLIIATPWPIFQQLPHAVLLRKGGRLPIIDCWRLLPPMNFQTSSN